MKIKLNSLLVILVLMAGIQPILAQLGIAPYASNQTAVFWPTGVTNPVLVSTTNLSSQNWVLASGVPIMGIAATNTSPALFYRLYSQPAGLALVPAGSFTMGDTLDGEGDARPTNIYVSTFFMDTNLTSYGLWQGVYNWATNNGYVFDKAGEGGDKLSGAKRGLV